MLVSTAKEYEHIVASAIGIWPGRGTKYVELVFNAECIE